MQSKQKLLIFANGFQKFLVSNIEMFPKEGVEPMFSNQEVFILLSAIESLSMDNNNSLYCKTIRNQFLDVIYSKRDCR